MTILTHRRPDYLRATLTALRACEGLDDWHVLVVLDRPDPETRGVVVAAAWPSVSLDLWNDGDPPYGRISRATLLALALGFAQSDYVAHLEEDCVPDLRFLAWHAEVSEAYVDDPRVFTVNAWSGPVGTRHAADHVAPHFTPWGWGTWQDRFDEMRAGWDLEHWDRHLNERVRGDRLSVFAQASLVRNIGRIGTQPEAEWVAREIGIADPGG